MQDSFACVLLEAEEQETRDPESGLQNIQDESKRVTYIDESLEFGDNLESSLQ